MNNNHILKLLKILSKNPSALGDKNAVILFGLIKSDILKAKKFCLENNLIEQIKKEHHPTKKGLKMLAEADFKEKTNVEYLKDDKISPAFTKAIRNLAKNLFDNEPLKENSLEKALKMQLKDLDKKIKKDFEKNLLSDKKINLSDFLKKFENLKKPLKALLLLDMLSKNKEKIAIYEKNQFNLKLDYLVFDRMICVPQNFDFQKTVVENNPLLERVSEFLLPEKSNNILQITKGFYRFIKSLEKFTLSTETLSKKTLRFRNAALNAKDPINLFFKDIPKVLCNKALIDCDDEFVFEFKKVLDELKNAKTDLSEKLKTFLLETFNEKEKSGLIKRFSLLQGYIGEKELKILSNNVLNDAEDILWTDRIATFINKSRVPKDWSDEDIADFKVKIKSLYNKFILLESVAGDENAVFDKTLKTLLTRVQKLDEPRKNLFLRRVVNG